MPELMIPRIHLNGTSAAELISQIAASRCALREALDVLAKATPHDRDYYVIDHRAGLLARAQHHARMKVIEDIMDELEQIAQGILAQAER